MSATVTGHSADASEASKATDDPDDPPMSAGPEMGRGVKPLRHNCAVALAGATGMNLMLKIANEWDWTRQSG